MSAARARADLAATGHDLCSVDGNPGERRLAALLRARTASVSPRGSFADLKTAPAWLRAPRARQRRLAHAVALAALAPRLAQSIDGGWLGGLATEAGEDLLDWAIDRAAALPPCDVPSVAPNQLAALGYGLLARQLAPGLHGYLSENVAEYVQSCPNKVIDSYLFSAMQIAPLK